ncbi:MAG: AMP-binding protein [Lachnospiraceae bacterium]|nr:AMP-binding protein [Lachnospiraceae bacterium]
MLYFDYLTETIRTMGDKPAFVFDGESITFSEVDQEAAKVYRYLKEKGIGEEQIVQILMPKELHFFSCMLGVWRAGAAFVLVQDNYPKDRIDFIREDTNSVLVLDQTLFDTIMETAEPLEGYEETKPHQLAYVVYTSGSTGTPKGIMHEYGNIERCVSSVPANRKASLPDEKPLTGPLSFVHTLLNLVYNTMDGITTLLEPEEKLRDFNYYKEFILKKKLTSFYLPPSYIRIYKDPSPYLKVIGTGSEPANGLYYPGGTPAILNTYSCSEAGFAVMNCILEKAYDVAPIGRPLPGVEAVLVDDDDQIIEGEGTGELCIKNDFFRGYLNQPELTARAKRGGYFHTADICRRDADGLYYIVGRADDMIKINGNRIEPAEIEAAVEKCTGLEKVVAKGFAESSRAYVAVYYLREEAEKKGLLKGETLQFEKDKLEEILPRYMIPTYYVPLEAFPLNASSKINKKALKPPATARADHPYVAPKNETERYLCENMAKALNLEKVGADEDFFESGGDSMRCIQFVSLCDELDISAAQVFKYRTATALAMHCKRKRSEEENEKENREAMTETFPLLPGQLENIYCQSYAPESGFLNQYFGWRLSSKVDGKKFAEALNQVIEAHPGLQMRIFRDQEGNYRQKYDASFYEPVEIERITEADLPEKEKEIGAVIPIENGRLYRFRIYQTERSLLFFGAVHHVITDGSAMRLFSTDLMKTLVQSDYEIEKDYYYAVIKRLFQAKGGTDYQASEKAFREKFNAVRAAGTPLGLKKDRDSEERKADLIRMERQFERRPNRDSNFYLTACALAEAWYNETEHAFITMIYGCRDDHERVSAFGLLVNNMTMCLHAPDGADPKEMLSAMEEQVQRGIAAPEYSYIEQEIGDSSDMVRYIYQKDVYRKAKPNPLIEENLDLVDRSNMPGSVSISIIDNTGEDEIRISVRYSVSNYDKESIERYIGLISSAVDYLEGKAGH